MHRAARLARQRAEAAAKSAGAPFHPEERSRGVPEADSRRDLRALSFSQAQGYEDIPTPLKLEELPPEARVQIWNAFYFHIERSLDNRRRWVIGAWANILKSRHAMHDNRPLDEWSPEIGAIRRDLRKCIETLPFNRLFDLIQFTLRHSSCPPNFASRMRQVFLRCRLAYTIDEGQPPTIVPAVTPEEGSAVIGALQTLRKARLGGAESHLRNASECINARDWAGSVRESIHAVESVARQLDSKACGGLKPALESLERRGGLHPALKAAFNKLYGYTSDEQGVRHALLDRPDHNVRMDEALFMLSACASFASYLWRKHVAEEAP
jgi:hypothetical protein